MPDPSFLNPISVRSEIGSIAIDITQKVTENYPTIITDNPIENGSPTTDHVLNLPPRIQIQGGFSDIRVTNLVGSLLPQDSIRNRAKNQFDKLLELKLKRTVFTVMDGLHFFQNMLFEDLQLLKDKEGFSVYFQADIKGVQIIDLGVTNQAVSTENSLNRTIVANTTLLTVGATVERASLFESIGVLT